MDADDVPHIRYGLETAVAVVGTSFGGGNGSGVRGSDGVGGIDANGGDIATVGREVRWVWELWERVVLHV